MAKNKLAKKIQKQIRMTEFEAKWLSKESFDQDRSESWIIRKALEKVYPKVFGRKKVVDSGNETDESRKKVA